MLDRMRKCFPVPSAAAVMAAASLAPLPALAHCPLCTAGAGVLAVAAAAIGVNPMAIGIFIGAFAAALGLWMSRLLKKAYLPRQAPALAVVSFLATVLPLIPLFDSYTSVFVSIVGEYGTPLNRTYLVNRFAAGAVFGALVLALAPAASRTLTRARKGAFLPYQGLVITFGLLISSALLVQLFL